MKFTGATTLALLATAAAFSPNSIRTRTSSSSMVKSNNVMGSNSALMVASSEVEVVNNMKRKRTKEVS